MCKKKTCGKGLCPSWRCCGRNRCQSRNASKDLSKLWSMKFLREVRVVVAMSLASTCGEDPVLKLGPDTRRLDCLTARLLLLNERLARVCLS